MGGELGWSYTQAPGINDVKGWLVDAALRRVAQQVPGLLPERPLPRRREGQPERALASDWLSERNESVRCLPQSTTETI